MEVFDPSISISPSSFRQDRIVIKVGDWEIEGTNDQITQFNRRLCSARNGRIPDDELGWIFNSPDGGVSGAYKFKIRDKRSNVVGSPPLFKGFLKVYYRGSSTNSDGAVLIRKGLELTLTINPTRFASYQSVTQNQHDNPEEWIPEVNMRLSRPDEFSEVGDVTVRTRYRRDALDGSDNFLPESHRNLLDDDSWMVQLRAYLNGVVEEINNEFVRAAGQSNLECNFNTMRRGRRLTRLEPLYTFSECESYLEFHPPEGVNAVQFVHNLFPLLTQYRRHRVDLYDVRSNNSESLDSSKSVSLNISEGIKLKVYAKTFDRVRFEFRFNLTKCSELLHEGDSKARTTQEEEELIHWIQILNSLSAELLADFFEFIQNRQQVSSEEPAYLLPFRIREVVSDSTIAEGILTALVANGSITLRRTRDRYHRHINSLLRVGVLVRNGDDGNSCRTFTVSEPFQHALELLRSDRIINF